MVDSVDDFKSSRSIRGYTHFPTCDMLDARIASAVNKIIQTSHVKKKVSLEEQKPRKKPNEQKLKTMVKRNIDQKL